MKRLRAINVGRRLKVRWLNLVVMGVALSALASPAWAQKPVKPPEGDSGILSWVIAAGIAVVVCVTAFMNPKRSHLN